MRKKNSQSKLSLRLTLPSFGKRT